VARLTASLPGDPDSTAAQEVVLRSPRPAAAASVAGSSGGRAPAPISLQLSRPRVVSGEDEVRVEIRREGRALGPGELAAARAETSLGTVVPAAGGLRWVLPRTFGGRFTATLQVDVGGATAEAEVGLVPGLPAVGRIAFDAAEVGGGQTVGAKGDG